MTPEMRKGNLAKLQQKQLKTQTFMAAHLRLTTMEFWAENKALNCKCERCDQDKQKTKPHPTQKHQKTTANGNP